VWTRRGAEGRSRRPASPWARYGGRRGDVNETLAPHRTYARIGIHPSGFRAPVSRIPGRHDSSARVRAGRPRIAIVGWRLGGELERAIQEGSERFSYVVASMTLPAELRSLVEWHRIPLLKWNSFRLRWAIFFILGSLRLARIDADLVHTVGPTPIVPNRVDLNTVTFCHAAFHEATADDRVEGSSIGWRIGQPLARTLERWWFKRRVRVLVGLSEGSAEDLRRHYPGVEVALMPRGIDLQRFRPDLGARRRLREEQSVGSDEVVALFVDQDHRPLKGLEVAIEAFAAARRSGDGPDLLWVLGAGNERHTSLADRLEVGNRIRFLGYKSEVERFYQAADIFVLPTAYESFCRSAHEAAACGLPVVAPPVNGVRELIGADEAGIIAGRDPVAVARALVALSGDRGRRARMGRVGRRRSVAFDQDTAARSILALHESLLDSARLRAR
jgi:glycosyltransferase involved in cell wall biosynthesis